MNREAIIDRLRKMKALADSGVGGERENAQCLLAAIAAEHGISIEQLDEVQLKTFYITLSRAHKRKLLSQLCALKRQELKREGVLLSDDRMTLWSCREKGWYAVRDCSDAEWVELLAKFEILSRAFQKQEDEFYTAFLQANDLLLDADEGPQPELSREDRRRLFRIAQMSMGIEKTHLAQMIEERR